MYSRGITTSKNPDLRKTENLIHGAIRQTAGSHELTEKPEGQETRDRTDIFKPSNINHGKARFHLSAQPGYGRHPSAIILSGISAGTTGESMILSSDPQGPLRRRDRRVRAQDG